MAPLQRPSLPLAWFYIASMAGIAATAGLNGCTHNAQTVAAPPPPPVQATGSSSQTASSPSSRRTSGPSVSSPAQVRPYIAPAPGTETSVASASEKSDQQFVASHQPIYTEQGVASWYGPPYNKRRGANGQIFDENALTAAHRTLPMNSLIRVSNVATGQAAIVRVTDRGPFVQGRLLDLSVASAKVVGIWRPGTATVRVDVYQAPAPIESGGRWCVQVGAFKSGGEALKLRDHMLRKYHTANVIEFTGPTGHWVRIRPDRDDKGRAIEIAKELKPAQGDAYLVRLD